MSSAFSPEASANRSEAVAWRLPLAVVGAMAVIGYLVQLASPLRLNSDAVPLLKMVVAHAQGHGWNPPEVSTYHSPGYPICVALLERIGLGSGRGIVALNLLFVCLGVWSSVRAIAGALGATIDARMRLLIGVLTLVSFAMVKHATLPTTDVAYFGCAGPRK